MLFTKLKVPVFLILSLVIAPISIVSKDVSQSEREATYHRYLEFRSLIKGGSIKPHWMADGSSFWYAEGAPDKTVIYEVDPKTNTKKPLFDTARLRKNLTPLLGHKPSNQGIPFDSFTFVDDNKTVARFTIANKEFILQLDSYTIKPVFTASDEEALQMRPQNIRRSSQYDQNVWSRGRFIKEKRSPDGRWLATVKEYDLWLRSADGSQVQLTTDGSESYAWDLAGAIWSPDGSQIAVKRIDLRLMPRLPIVPWLEDLQKPEFIPHRRAGGPLPQLEVYVVDTHSKERRRLDTGDEIDQYTQQPGNAIVAWRDSNSEVILLRQNRLSTRFELLLADAANGLVRVVLADSQKTFIPTWRARRFLTLLNDGERFIWKSERDGWSHLYLYNLNGKLIRRLTEGKFAVYEVVTVDESNGWVYFTAQGETQRLYDRHLYRVSLDGQGFERLTEATGQHSIRFSPSRRFFLDVHSTVIRPPMTELRAADGALLQILSRADISALEELDWKPPEEFVSKADDGETDLHGVLYKPNDFDPSRKYPVIEYIYGGFWTTRVPRTFSGARGLVMVQALAQLGFIVFVIDSRGTPGRSKSFQDVGHHGGERHIISDHEAVLKQIAAQRPYMDLSRVGIYGHSNGGANTIRALLLAPDTYHVGVASASMVDWEDTDLAEAWMGLPANNQEGYKLASIMRLAGNLKGKLLLAHGTSDRTVPFAQTLKMVEALINADKPFDLLVLPEDGHGFSGSSRRYFNEVRRKYFQEHLNP